jgi:hypothetical protein
MVVLGLALTTAWCVLGLPALFVAEAGAGLTLRERALVAMPLAVGGALLITGGHRASLGAGEAGRWAAAGTGATVAGILAAIAALLVVSVPL